MCELLEKPAVEPVEEPGVESEEEQPEGENAQETKELEEPTATTTTTTTTTTPEPTPAPTHPPPQRQIQGLFSASQTQEAPYPMFLHNNFLMLFIFIGMIFILIGGILSGSAILSKNINVYGASIITISLGLFTMSTFLILAALFRNDLNHFIRLGLLIIGAFSILGLILYATQALIPVG